jgi:hypothetical protein
MVFVVAVNLAKNTYPQPNYRYKILFSCMKHVHKTLCTVLLKSRMVSAFLYPPPPPTPQLVYKFDYRFCMACKNIKS